MSKKKEQKLPTQIREPSAEYVRAKDIPAFFGQPMLKGTYAQIDSDPLNSQVPALYYSHPHGEIWVGDSIAWLRSLPDESVDLVFADPPYNIKKAEWDTFESQQEYVNWSLEWIEQAARILKPTGTLYICGFSEILADLKLPALRFFQGCRWLVWHYKNKANLGADWGRSHESILHLRKSRQFTFNVDDVRIPYGNHTLKYPEHPQAETSQYGKGRTNHLWQPNPKVPSRGMSWKFPRRATGCTKRPRIPLKSRKSCCGKSSWLRPTLAIWLLTRFWVQARRLLWPSNSSADGKGATFRLNIASGRLIESNWSRTGR